MIRIAGRVVKIGSRLYSKQFDTFGYVRAFDPTGSAELVLKNRAGARRRLYVTDGGLVNGVKAVYWHTPIEMDLPFDDITPVQNVASMFALEMLKIVNAKIKLDASDFPPPPPPPKKKKKKPHKPILGPGPVEEPDDDDDGDDTADKDTEPGPVEEPDDGDGDDSGTSEPDTEPGPDETNPDDEGGDGDGDGDGTGDTGDTGDTEPGPVEDPDDGGANG